MAIIDLQDGSGGLGEVVFVAATAEGDTAPSGVHNGSWTKGFFLLVDNGGGAPATVYVNVTDHDEYDNPIASNEVVVAAGKIGFVPVVGGRLGQSVVIEYSDATDLDVALVTSLEGYVLPPEDELS